MQYCILYLWILDLIEIIYNKNNVACSGAFNLFLFFSGFNFFRGGRSPRPPWLRACLFLAHENVAESNPVIIPYKVVTIRFMSLYGLVTRSLMPTFHERYLCKVHHLVPKFLHFLSHQNFVFSKPHTPSPNE